MSFDPAPVDLAGKTCLVTGANGGIGLAVAEHFSALGAEVLATDVGEHFAGAFETRYARFDLLEPDGRSRPTMPLSIYCGQTVWRHVDAG